MGYGSMPHPTHKILSIHDSKKEAEKAILARHIADAPNGKGGEYDALELTMDVIESHYGEQRWLTSGGTLPDTVGKFCKQFKS